ncbi:unnamed protein product, partial [Didymodactylos carnosus]
FSLKLDRWYEYVNAANPEESESEPEPQTPNLIDMEEDDDVPKPELDLIRMLTVLLLNWGSRNRDIVESDRMT